MWVHGASVGSKLLDAAEGVDGRLAGEFAKGAHGLSVANYDAGGVVRNLVMATGIRRGCSTSGADLLGIHSGRSVV